MMIEYRLVGIIVSLRGFPVSFHTEIIIFHPHHCVPDVNVVLYCSAHNQNAMAALEVSPLKECKTRHHRPHYVIMQWNQKDLTLLSKTSDGYADSVERANNVARTIMESKSGKSPAICVFQEVRTGGGGKRALEYIVNCLNSNKKSKNTTWRYHLSGEVNPQGRRREMYAVIWCTDIMGDLCADSTSNGHRLMTDGFSVSTYRRHTAAAEEATPSFLIGNASIDLTDARTVWNQLDSGGNVNLYFDRAPVLFSFNPPEINFAIHLIVCHSATGGESKSPHQNMIESAYLQTVCTQAANQGEYVVLMGDFNTAEDHNQTEYMWDTDVAFLSESDEDLFGSIKTDFLERYYRGVPSALPTNVYPFLAGENATPRHNDDIWISTDFDKMHQITYEGELDSRGNKHGGVVLKIPTFVLTTWDNKTRAYFDKIGNSKLKGASKHTLNRMLSMAWSDHRPILVDLLPVEFNDNPLNAAFDEDEEMTAVLMLFDRSLDIGLKKFTDAKGKILSRGGTKKQTKLDGFLTTKAACIA